VHVAYLAFMRHRYVDENVPHLSVPYNTSATPAHNLLFSNLHSIGFFSFLQLLGSVMTIDFGAVSMERL
jgi:hypothetical protein